ncbi:MAG TPA: HAMP domain-containing sensor histidine kinase [Pseudogracilibacillus sp.]|nr:HAMP domain-containing sensor histidine kinase [Pseudogracilibacillus sp.]
MKLRGRISFHFLIQFFILFAVTFLVIIGLLILVVNFITNDEFKTNPREAVIENIPTYFTVSDEEEVSIDDKWKKQLKENQMWLQVINEQGEVIYNANTPADIENAYTINELLEMEETDKAGDFTVELYYDEWMTYAYYFLFGYEEMEKEQLKSWHDQFSKAGKIDSEAMSDLEKQLKPENASVEIYKEGQLIQSAGDKLEEDSGKMNILASIHSPGKQKTKAFTYTDEKNDTAWIYRIPNENYSKEGIPFLNSELQMLLVALFISLFIAILFSVWSGYRYGKPMIIMIRWLEEVEKKQYERILSEKEQRKVFKRNGKIKFRYRLYKEVIQSFSNMTAKLARADREREELDRVREEWMAGISHDLRTPLSSIQGYGHIMESDKYDYSAEELQQIGQVIRTKSDYMVDLLNDFSFVFQLKNKAVTMQVAPIDLNAYTEDIVSKFNQDFINEEYTIRLENSEEDVIALADPKLFKRVLDNFLSNAVKHNPPQTIITVKVFEEGGYPFIQITDNGKGMEQAFLDQLFNRYYRGTSTQERTEGEGLGMSIAKAVIELHEGDVQVRSEKHKGTTIKIHLQNPVCVLRKHTN